jgi:hypothetical protein
VEVSDVHSSNETDNLLGLRLTFSYETRKINLRISRNGVVDNNVKILKRNATSSDIGQDKRRDLLLLKLLDRLAQLELRNVSDQLNRSDTTLLQDNISKISV